MYRQSFLISALAVFLTWAQPCLATTQEGSDEESAVYSVALKKIFPNNKFSDEPIKFFVIEDQTRIDSYDGPSILKDNLKDYIPEISEDTLNNFKLNNNERHPLGVPVNFPFKYVLMKSSEALVGDWRAFYSKYKGAPGLISFSKVGFNKQKDEALVYVARANSEDSGGGHLILLKKKKNTWKVTKEETLWVWVG